MKAALTWLSMLTEVGELLPPWPVYEVFHSVFIEGI
jgi:hypothetical protein